MSSPTEIQMYLSHIIRFVGFGGGVELRPTGQTEFSPQRKSKIFVDENFILLFFKSPATLCSCRLTVIFYYNPWTNQSTDSDSL